MTSIADSSVKIQTTSESNFSTPAWFGVVMLISKYLQKHRVLTKIDSARAFCAEAFWPL